jgi:hypothetical protein
MEQLTKSVPMQDLIYSVAFCPIGDVSRKIAVHGKGYLGQFDLNQKCILDISKCLF